MRFGSAYTNGCVVADQDDALYKSRLLSGLVRQREDVALRHTVVGYDRPLDFKPLENLMISEAAWRYARDANIEPRLVFAHPVLLQAHPEASQYYRGMAVLSQKQVQQLATSVSSWEDVSRKRTVREDSCLKVSRLYNAVLSSIIEDSSDWTLENGYRNIIATMGIRLDGMFRNKIGQMAEELIKSRILDWLLEHGFVEESDDGFYWLPHDYEMHYGSEPDIWFEREGRTVATIEIKGGKDPAGALERLGAMQKSFAETPPGCTNILIAGVVTPAMQTRLDQMGVVKVYELGDLAVDGVPWDAFTREMFHHIIRIS